MNDKYLYIVRHGETNWNKDKKWQGGENDIELNEEGISQSIKTGKYLNNYQQDDLKFDLIISSCLIRAKDTAKIIANEINYPVNEIIYDSDLNEKFYGKISGKTPDEIKKSTEFNEYNNLYQEWEKIKDPIKRIDKLEELENKLFTNFGVETTNNIKKRCENILAELINCSSKKILIVTHGGIISGFLKLLFNLKWDLPKGKLIGEGNCKIALIKYQNKKFNLVTAPTNEHLEFINL